MNLNLGACSAQISRLWDSGVRPKSRASDSGIKFGIDVLGCGIWGCKLAVCQGYHLKFQLHNRTLLLQAPMGRCQIQGLTLTLKLRGQAPKMGGPDHHRGRGRYHHKEVIAKQGVTDRVAWISLTTLLSHIPLKATSKYFGGTPRSQPQIRLSLTGRLRFNEAV